MGTNPVKTWEEILSFFQFSSWHSEASSVHTHLGPRGQVQLSGNRDEEIRENVEEECGQGYQADGHCQSIMPLPSFSCFRYLLSDAQKGLSLFETRTH